MAKEYKTTAKNYEETKPNDDVWVAPNPAPPDDSGTWRMVGATSARMVGRQLPQILWFWERES